jgi:uncharacterized damage-inducible protein DinB
MAADDFPGGYADDRELFLAWLRYLRGAVLRNLDGLDDAQARWRPDGSLVSVLGVVNHLTHVEWRWIDGGFLGSSINRSEEEFHPSSEMTVESVRERYLQRAAQTDQAVLNLTLRTRCRIEEGTDLRWVLLHLINETARHAGHADATRELLDGKTGQ